MKIISIENGNKESKAVFFEELPRGEELRKLVNILDSSNNLSDVLLIPTFPGSVPDVMGADYTLLLALHKVSEGGIYAVDDWVSKVLDKTMPKGMGAALTQPALFRNKVVNTKENVWVVVVSPMNRLKTEIAGVFLADPRDDEIPTMLYRR